MAFARASLTLPALAILAVAGVRPAFAEVIQIGKDGGVTRFAGPAVYTDRGAVPLAPQPTPNAQASPAVSQIIAEAADRQAISGNLLSAMALRESNLRPNAISPKGAFGVMQLMPQTATSLGVDRFDTSQNIHGGAAYMRQMLNRYHGDLVLSLAAYNAGPGAVDRYRGVPPFAETKAYVGAILGRLADQAAVAAKP